MSEESGVSDRWEGAGGIEWVSGLQLLEEKADKCCPH